MASNGEIDMRSGFCKSNSIFYGKRKPIPLPVKESLDVTTYISTRAHHGKIAFIDGLTGRYITFSELWRAVDSVATCLYEMGIRKGQVILVLTPNSIFFPIICLAVMSVGAILNTTNPLNTEQEIAKQIADSKPVLAFTIGQLIPKLAGSLLPIILVDDQKTTTSSAGTKIVATLIQMMQKEPSETRVTNRVKQDDIATMLYSSGTTGDSKGVLTTHRSMIAMVETILTRYNTADGHQTFLCAVPMFHIFGLSWFVMGHVAAGSTTVIYSKFDMHEVMSAVSKYRVTYLPLFPPVVVVMVSFADQILSKYDLSSLQSVLSGGAPLSKETIEGFVNRYPTLKMLQGYGMTETAAIASTTDTLEESRRYGTAGMLSPSMEAKIIDPVSGKALSVNQTGELWLKGPTVMKGYFNNPEATKSTIDPEGWLRTGDLCYIDDDGFLFVVDRLKELIKYKGYQVAPAELEALLLTHPEISDSAVIPFPDKEAGQLPMAYVIRKPGSRLSESEVMNFVARQVAPYKRIRRVAFVASIPKNPTGKILRRELVKLATSKL